MNAGDTGFMLICSALVFFMTPGLAFFYGGLVRRKNVVSTMMAWRSDYGIVGCHVGIVWIFTVFWWKIMQELLEISGGLDCMELK